jgi:hypothetical protein
MRNPAADGYGTSDIWQSSKEQASRKTENEPCEIARYVQVLKENR